MAHGRHFLCSRRAHLGGEPHKIYKIAFSPGDGFMAAIGLAANAMILWRHFRIKREEQRTGDG